MGNGNLQARKTSIDPVVGSLRQREVKEKKKEQWKRGMLGNRSGTVNDVTA